MIGTHYGVIIGGGNGFFNGVHAKCLCVRLSDSRMIILLIPTTNHVFRINDFVNWNDSELYWHPNMDTCIKFNMIGSLL